MKITKAQLRQIIKEELGKVLNEGMVASIEKTDVSGAEKLMDPMHRAHSYTAPDDVEVQIEGYGKLEIGQIRNGLTKRVAEALRVDWRADPLRGLDHLLAGGVVEAFYKTLKAHNAYWPAEEEE